MLLQADRGTVHFELRFVPFKKAGDQITGEDAEGEPQMSRTLTKGAAKPEHKGVLTVTLVKGSALVVSWHPYGAENVCNAVAQLQRRCGVARGPVSSRLTGTLVRWNARMVRHQLGRCLSYACRLTGLP